MIETKNILLEAVSQALETMVFLDVLPADENTDELIMPQTLVVSAISFSGPKKGNFQLLTGTDFGKLLAENIAAIDQADENQALDAVKELSNVICGLLLPEISENSSDVFDVTVPTVKTGSDSLEWSGFLQDKDSLLLNAEGYAIAVKLRMEE